MTHTDRLIGAGVRVKPDTTISLPVARDHGYYAGILYPFLQDKQFELRNFGGSVNVREDIRWIPGLTMSDIARELPVFPDAETVRKASRVLTCAGFIRTESTGMFLKPDRKTYKWQDTATWWHVFQLYVAQPTPVESLAKTERMKFSALEAAVYGMGPALIMAHFRTSTFVECDDDLYARLSAVELEKGLPTDERSIRRHLKMLVALGVLAEHPRKPKLYRQGEFTLTTVAETSKPQQGAKGVVAEKAADGESTPKVRTNRKFVGAADSSTDTGKDVVAEKAGDTAGEAAGAPKEKVRVRFVGAEERPAEADPALIESSAAGSESEAASDELPWAEFEQKPA